MPLGAALPGGENLAMLGRHSPRPISPFASLRQQLEFSSEVRTDTQGLLDALLGDETEEG